MQLIHGLNCIESRHLKMITIHLYRNKIAYYNVIIYFDKSHAYFIRIRIVFIAKNVELIHKSYCFLKSCNKEPNKYFSFNFSDKMSVLLLKQR